MKTIRVGVLGAGRGMSLARSFMLLDAEIVAICDNNKEQQAEARKQLDKSVAIFDNFDDFIEYPMDAVVLANNFHQHVPFAIKCFEKNLHVLCECISNGTMGEGVELVRAFEKSDSIYMLAENYPFSLFNQELKRVADGGTLGKILYAEGEYNHPVSAWDTDFTKRHRYYPKHWRNFLPATYYITHSLGPVMYFTDATPKKVSAFAVYAPVPEDAPTALYVGDQTANITTHNDDGSVFRVTAFSQYGAHHNSYRICGTKGQVENLRGMGDQVMLRYNEWDKPEGCECNRLYTPEWQDKDEKRIQQSGHDGCDYLMARLFLECVRAGKQPPRPFDLHSATIMSSVGILAHRSVLEGGRVYDIPDFRNEEDCKQYENDYLTPFYGSDGSEPTLPCCSHPDYKPSEKQMALYLKELEK